MTTALDMLAAYINAEKEVLAGKEIRFMDRQLRMEDLAEIRAGRAEWQRAVDSETAQNSGAPSFGGLTFSVASFGHQ